MGKGLVGHLWLKFAFSGIKKPSDMEGSKVHGQNDVNVFPMLC